jgi:hypothetical protein
MLFLSILIMVSASFSTGVKVMEDGETRLDINVLKGGIIYRISAASNSTVLVFEQMEGSFRFRVFGNAGDAGYLRIVQPVGLNSSSIKVFSNNSRLVFPSADPPRSIASNGTHYFTDFTFIFQSTFELTVTFTGEGDANYDGTVDIYDAILLAGAYNSVPGNRNWNAHTDLNDDSTVDIYDAIILASSYGKDYR